MRGKKLNLIRFGELPEMLPQRVHGALRCEELYVPAERAQPAEKRRAHRHRHGHGEISLARGDEHGVRAEPVDHGTGERIAAFEPDVLRRARKHAEMGACIRAHIERGEGLAPFAPVSGGAQIGDLVHAEVADLGKGTVVADEVVVLVVPEQGIGAHVVPCAAAAQNAPAVPVVSRVVEPDALVAVDGGVQLVHQIIYGFVHRLDAVFDDDLPPQLLGLMHAGQPFKLCDQLQRLLARNEPRGLHAVGQQPARPLYYVQNRGKRAAQRQASLLEQDLKTEIF